MEIKRISDKISYIPQVDEPLSSDVFIIKGSEKMYVYDVGNNNAATSWLNSQSIKKAVIISHFHKDHTANIEYTVFDKLFVGNQTHKSLNQGEIVTEPISINDGVQLLIMPIPSSHSKGSLCLMIDNDYLLLGDSIYSMQKEGKAVYNASLLKEQILFLENLPANKLIPSHNNAKVRDKAVVLRLLNGIYRKWDKSSPYIEL